MPKNFTIPSLMPKPYTVGSERQWDGWLLIVVCALLGIGVVMVYSASAITATWNFGDSTFFLKRQVTYVILGFVMLIMGLKIDYRWYQRLVYPILLTTITLLLLVVFIGTTVGGATRWIRIASFNVQPAEIAKVTLVFVLAYSMAKKQDKITSFSVGFVPHVLLVFFIIGLLLLQPDFGSSVLITCLMGAMLVFAGTRLIYIISGIVIAGAGAFFLISQSEYRMKRILAFMDPWSHQDSIAYQLTESMISIGSGGLSGRGLGEGLGKLGFVPELHTDFVGTAIAEELGFIGIAVVLVLYTLIMWRGFLIAIRARDYFGRYVAFGLTFMITLQAGVNLCVITGLVPTKGLTLPLISFGGSSLLMSMFAVGVLLNISKCSDDSFALELAQKRSEKEHERWEKKRERILNRRKERS